MRGRGHDDHNTGGRHTHSSRYRLVRAIRSRRLLHRENRRPLALHMPELPLAKGRDLKAYCDRDERQKGGDDGVTLCEVPAQVLVAPRLARQCPTMFGVNERLNDKGEPRRSIMPWDAGSATQVMLLQKLSSKTVFVFNALRK
jgi:hypothetical protein